MSLSSASSLPTSSQTFGREEQLLLMCARTRVSEQTSERIRKLAQGPLDWGALINGATAHGVLPLLCRQLLTICPESVPAEWHERSRTRLEEIAHHNLLLTAEMLRLAGRFRAEGLLAVPYKGPLLASEAYGDLALREFVDLDFAVRQRDIPRAHALLLADGYEAVSGEISPGEDLRPTHSDYMFFRTEGRIVVDIHSELTLRYFPRPLNFDSLSSRLKRVSLGGGETLSFSLEDTFIFLAVHGAKHFWQRLMWIADIAELVQAPGGMEWLKLFDRAAGLGVGRMVNLALYVAHHLLEAPLPREVLQRVNGDSGTRKLGQEVCARFSLVPLEPPVFRRFRFRVASRDSFWQGLRYAMRIATLPTDPDRKDLPLPAPLVGLRRFLRPLLLMKRYGIRRSKPRQTH